MWCDRCRVDAAANVSAETGRAACATCGAELGLVRRPATDQARELLKRWSADSGLDQTGGATSKIDAAGQAGNRTDVDRPIVGTDDDVSENRRSHAHSETFRPSHLGTRHAEPKSLQFSESASIAAAESTSRSSSTSAIDPIIHPLPAPPSADAPQSPPPTEKGAPEMFGHSKPRRGTTESWPAPTVQLAPAWPKKSAPKKRSSMGQIFGHLLAYVGILAVTGGTALVIWGYFGGPADYAPTGWLVATGGQMLLFLGVVTLVSEGLEKSSREMRSQVEILDHRLERIERNAAKTALQTRLNGGGASVSATPHVREAVGA